MDKAAPTHRKISRLAACLPLLAAALAGTGCQLDSQPWGEMPKAFGVQYATGDRAELYDAQLGLRGEGAGYGELAAEGGLDVTGPVRAVCSPAGKGDHPAFRVRLTSMGEEAGFEVTVTVPDFHGEGSYEGRVRVERVGGGGRLLASEGAAEVILDDAVHSAAVHAMSGTFSAEVAGEAGRGTLRGSFERCYFLT